MRLHPMVLEGKSVFKGCSSRAWGNHAVPRIESESDACKASASPAVLSPSIKPRVGFSCLFPSGSSSNTLIHKEKGFTVRRHGLLVQSSSLGSLTAMPRMSRRFNIKKEQKKHSHTNKNGTIFQGVTLGAMHPDSPPTFAPRCASEVSTVAVPGAGSSRSRLPRVRDFKEGGGAVREASCGREILLHPL